MPKTLLDMDKTNQNQRKIKQYMNSVPETQAAKFATF
jgi:hypothetical protein